MNKKLLYKILGVVTLALGLVFITLGLIDLFTVINHNSNLPSGADPLRFKQIYSIIATPCMFAGVFFVALGWGKEKSF